MRIFSIILFVAAAVFGIDIPWIKGPCLGEVLFHQIGIPVFSDGTQGLYFPGIISIVGQLIAIVLFSMTTSNKRKTLNLLLSIFVVICVVMWILDLFII